MQDKVIQMCNGNIQPVWSMRHPYQSERLNIGPQGVSCTLRWHSVFTYTIHSKECAVWCVYCVFMFRGLLWDVCSLLSLSEKVIKCLWLWQIGTGSLWCNSEHESLGMVHTGTNMMMHFILYSRYIAVGRQLQVSTGNLRLLGNYLCNLTQAGDRHIRMLSKAKILPHYWWWRKWKIVDFWFTSPTKRNELYIFEYSAIAFGSK